MMNTAIKLVALCCALVLYSGSEATINRQNVRQYAATLDNSVWSVKTATALRCELVHAIPQFGEARFVSTASKESNLLFQLKMQRQPDGYSLAEIGRAHV